MCEEGENKERGEGRGGRGEGREERGGGTSIPNIILFNWSIGMLIVMSSS